MTRVWSSSIHIAVVLLVSSAAVGAATMPDTIDRVKPSVVAIGTYQKTRSPPFVFRGTGFVVADGTVVATNVHVLPESLSAENRETLLVLTVNNQGGEPQPREAKPFATDRAHDLALLRISGAPL